MPINSCLLSVRPGAGKAFAIIDTPSGTRLCKWNAMTKLSAAGCGIDASLIDLFVVAARAACQDSGFPVRMTAPLPSGSM